MFRIDGILSLQGNNRGFRNLRFGNLGEEIFGVSREFELKSEFCFFERTEQASAKKQFQPIRLQAGSPFGARRAPSAVPTDIRAGDRRSETGRARCSARLDRWKIRKNFRYARTVRVRKVLGPRHERSSRGTDVEEDVFTFRLGRRCFDSRGSPREDRPLAHSPTRYRCCVCVYVCSLVCVLAYAQVLRHSVL